MRTEVSAKARARRAATELAAALGQQAAYPMICRIVEKHMTQQALDNLVAHNQTLAYWGERFQAVLEGRKHA